MNFSLVIIEMLRIKDLPTHFCELLTKIKVFNVETVSPGNTPARLRESSLKQQFLVLVHRRSAMFLPQSCLPHDKAFLLASTNTVNQTPS